MSELWASETVLGAAAADLQQRGLPIEVYETSNQVEALERGTIDVAVLADLPSVKQKFSTEPLGTFELGFMMPESHPWAHKPFVTFADFANDQLILPTEAPNHMPGILEGFRGAGIEPQVFEPRVHTRALIGSLVAAGLGVKPCFWSPSPGTVFRLLRPTLLVSYATAWPRQLDDEPMIDALRDTIRRLRGSTAAPRTAEALLS